VTSEHSAPRAGSKYQDVHDTPAPPLALDVEAEVRELADGLGLSAGQVDRLHKGVAIWSALQRRAGLSGSVLVGDEDHEDQGDLYRVGLGNPAGIVRAILKHVSEAGTGDPRDRTVCMGVIDGAAPSTGAKWARSAVVVASAAVSTLSGDRVDLDNWRAATPYLLGEASDLPEDLKEARARMLILGLEQLASLRAVAPTVDAALFGAASWWLLAEGELGSPYHLIVPLSEPLVGSAEEETEENEARNVFQFPRTAAGVEWVEAEYLRFSPFKWTIDALTTLAAICAGRFNGDVGATTTSSFEALNSLLRRWKRMGGSGRLWRKAHPRKEDLRQEFVVPGVIARGEVTVLVGSPGAGKGASALHLASEVAVPLDLRAGDPPFWAVSADQIGHGMSVFLTAEDRAGELENRRKRMRVSQEGEERSIRLPVGAGERSLDDALADLDAIDDLALVVVDNLRAFCDGDLDRSEVVGPFMAKLQTFARRKRCAVLLIHHFNKRVGRRRGRGRLIDDIHGSGAVVSAARVVLTMQSSDDNVRVSVWVEVSKLADVEVRELGQFVRDNDTFTLVEAKGRAHAGQTRANKAPGGGGAASGDTQPSSDGERVLMALEAALNDGRRVTRTGKHELYELGRPELAGVSRAKVRAGVEAAIAAGRVHGGSDGALSMVL